MLPRCPPWHSRHHRPPLNLPASQISAGWRLMPLWAPWLQLHSVHASVCMGLCVYAMFVHILCCDYVYSGKKSLLDGYHAEGSHSFSHLTNSCLSFVGWWAFGVQSASACWRDVSPNIVVYHPSGWRDRKKRREEERSQFFTLSAWKGNVVPL